MSTPIERLRRLRHSGSQRQHGTRGAAKNGGDSLADLIAESKMKMKTDLKAGSGCGLLSLDLDIDINLDVSLFGGCGSKKTKRC
jgi:hypothetical protein